MSGRACVGKVWKLLLSAAAMVVALSSCANFTKPLSATDRPTGKEAFVYGRFRVTSPFGLPLNGTIGFVMSCTDGREYRIKFDEARPIRVLAVAPASCSVTEAIFTNDMDSVVGTKPFPGRFLDGMRLEAGKAYYLGDYSGTAWVTGATGDYHVDPARDDFDSTTRDLKAAYPHLDKTPMINQLGNTLDAGKPYTVAERRSLTACVERGVASWHELSESGDDNLFDRVLELHRRCAEETVPNPRSTLAISCLVRTTLATMTLDAKDAGIDLRTVRSKLRGLPPNAFQQLGDFYNSRSSRSAVLAKAWDTCMDPLTKSAGGTAPSSP